MLVALRGTGDPPQTERRLAAYRRRAVFRIRASTIGVVGRHRLLVKVVYGVWKRNAPMGYLLGFLGFAIAALKGNTLWGYLQIIVSKALERLSMAHYSNRH